MTGNTTHDTKKVLDSAAPRPTAGRVAVDNEYAQPIVIPGYNRGMITRYTV